MMDSLSVTVGIASVIAIVFFIYSGAHIAIALGIISFVGVYLLKGNVDVAFNLLSLAMADSITDEAFATVPLFVMMGLVVSLARSATKRVRHCASWDATRSPNWARLRCWWASCWAGSTAAS